MGERASGEINYGVIWRITRIEDRELDLLNDELELELDILEILEELETLEILDGEILLELVLTEDIALGL